MEAPARQIAMVAFYYSNKEMKSLSNITQIILGLYISNKEDKCETLVYQTTLIFHKTLDIPCMPKSRAGSRIKHIPTPHSPDSVCNGGKSLVETKGSFTEVWQLVWKGLRSLNVNEKWLALSIFLSGLLKKGWGSDSKSKASGPMQE